MKIDELIKKLDRGWAKLFAAENLKSILTRLRTLCETAPASHEPR